MMNRIRVFFYIMLLLLQELPAQWIQQSSGAFENLTDVVMLDSIKAIAVGDRNGIFRTTDAGSTWVNETVMLSAVFHWNAISFSDRLNGVIVGDNAIWKTTDGGITWFYCNFPWSHKNTSVLQLNPENIYAGDDSGYVHHSADSGNTWSSEKISDLPVRSIYLLKANPEIFALYETSIYALTSNSLYVNNLNDTSSWKNWGPLGYFNGLGSGAFQGRFSENGTEFIVGVEGDFISQSAIIRLRLSDSHWYSVGPSIEIGELRGLSIPSSKIIYTCGSTGKILKSTNEGDDWISSCTATTRTLNSVYFFDNERGFAVGDSGTILYTKNGGIITEEPGQLVPFGMTDKVITSLSVERSDYNSLVPTSNLIFAGTENGVFQRTNTSMIDEKVTDWIPIGLENKAITALTVQHWGVGPADGLRLFAAVLPDSDKVDATLIFSREVQLSGDTNWIKSDSGIDNSVSVINTLTSFYYTGHTSPQPTLAGTNFGIYVNSFNLWTQSEIEGSTPQPDINAIDLTSHWEFAQNRIAWAAGTLGLLPAVFRSTNQGKIWQLILLPSFIEGTAKSVAINRRSTDSVYVVWNDAIFLTPDNGDNWKNIFSTQDIIINTIAIDPLYPENVFAGGWFFDDSHQSSNHGIFLHSTNGGKEWNEPDPTADKLLGEVTSIVVMNKTQGNKSYIFIGTHGTGVWEYKYSVITDAEKIYKFPEDFILHQNYPNPFNPVTTIKYELPKESNVHLVLYNLLGEKVAELVNSFQKAGMYEVKWNAKNFASGVYIYQLKAGNPANGTGFISSKKLILLK